MGIYLLIIFICTYITLEYRQHKMSKQYFVVWLVAVFLTGPFGFLLYLLCGKRYKGL
nr:PLDc N-terminal domain-containing protein [Bacillus thuringiensis]